MSQKLQLTDAALTHAFKNGGRLPGSTEKITLQDAYSVPDAPMLFPKVIQNIVREAVEPLLIGTSLLTRINFSGLGQTITFGATGGLEASDIAEGEEYPEQKLQTGAGTVIATIGKSGVAVKITEEMMRYSQFDVIGMHLRAAGKALARLKEQKIFNMIRNLPAPVFDNLTPASSLKGVTTGRSLDGAPNGSLTMDDIFDAWAHVVAQGFMPNTLIMHPLTWTMFVKDPTLRAFVLQNGGGNFFATWTGNPTGGTPQWANASQNGMGQSPGQLIVPDNSPTGLAATTAANQSQTLTSAPVLPNYGPGGLSVIVTPYVNFDPARRLSDIYLVDRSELGFYIVDEEPTTEEFNDPRVDMRKIKIRERYSLAIANEGHATAVLKNVKLASNEIVLPGRVQVDSSAITPIDPAASVV